MKAPASPDAKRFRADKPAVFVLCSLPPLWLVKAAWREPALYIGAYVALLAWRWWKRPRYPAAAAAVRS